MYGKVKGYDSAGPLVAASDASYKRGAAGIACVVSNGSWGLSRWGSGARHDPSGPATVLVAELRGVALLLEAPAQPRPRELLLDSTIAIRYLRAWQRGRIERMPEGYSLLPRRGPQPAPTLVRLAGIMAQHPEMQLHHVRSHTGHPLNEAADALASLAQRGLPAVETRSRAEGLAEVFLRPGHEQANPAGPEPGRPVPLLVRTGPPDDRPRGLPHDLQVQNQRPVLDVAEVEPDRFLPREVGAPAYLPEAGQAGLDGQPARHVVLSADRLLVRESSPGARA